MADFKLYTSKGSYAKSSPMDSLRASHAETIDFQTFERHWHSKEQFMVIKRLIDFTLFSPVLYFQYTFCLS